MKKYTIKSRKLGRDVTFSIPGSHYVFVDLNGGYGTQGQQICRGGRLNSGSTITSTEETLPITATKWLRQYLRGENELNK